ncbi:MAG: hypothetical protein DHS20C11_19070 [Lysobacteraceae bacterium]|nr:MAG: hypothetical protein DHS20C11_19070 [Xanthomonadaceae bacterium]
MTMNNAVCFEAFPVNPGSFNCPAGTMTCSGLLANIPLTMTATMASTAVPTNTGMHQCSWNCGGCGNYVLNNDNGLPVELMEFSVPD